MSFITMPPQMRTLQSALGGMVLPAGILVLVAMMVLPLPILLLDILFTFNILLSLLILMIALHTYRPLDFSSFPSMLLVATVLRLALNVASTRIVLSEGHNGTGAAGKVIEAFGAFVIGGNFAVGIFVFIILVIINLVVITKGAGRVSEVSARFTLDAMPGKQMAIDADLNAGILSPEEATAKREDVGREADFHGAMDGASKFVKGDAVAAILILAINVIGGLAIGITQHDLPLSLAAENYVILSVGDGLVAQIPSLLLSIATAIIVTRVSSSTDMAEHIASEVSLSRAWFPVAGVLALIGIVPGMPNMLFLIGALIALGIGVACLGAERETEMADVAPDMLDHSMEDDKDPNSLDVTDVADLAAISILLSYPLLNLVDDDTGGPLVRRITAIRKEVSQALGFVIPSVRVRDDLGLAPNLYRIKIGQTVVAEDMIYPDRKLAIPSDASNIKIDGMNVKEPSFGIDAIWIYHDRQAEAEAHGYVVIEPEAVLATHLSQILYKHAGELIGQDEVQELLDNLAKTAPSLVQSVVPKLVPLHNITAIVRNLLKERIPISDMRRILEVLSELAGRNMGVSELSEALRPYLVELLIQQSVPLNQPIPVITIDSDFEHLLINTARQSESEQLMLDGALAQRLVKSLTTTNEEQIAKGQKPHLVVSPLIRRKLSMFLRQYLPELIVLSFAELPEARKVEVVATISGNDGLLSE